MLRIEESNDLMIVLAGKRRRPRKARRRSHLVDRRPALAALAEADERLRELRWSESPDQPGINRADLARAQATGDLALALGVSPTWPVRQLRRRSWIAKSWIPADPA